MTDKPVVFITGGGGGLGAACARKLCESHTVVVTDLLIDAARNVADGIGGTARALDVSNPDDVEAVVDEIWEQVGAIDKVVHTAGIIQDRAFAPEQFAQDDWDKIQRINTKGTWIVCRAIGGRMAKRHGGSIVNIASLAGHRGWPTHSYAASKAAVISLTRGLAVEWGRSGVRVNSVSPGFTLTPKLEDLIKVRGWDSSAVANQTALGRWVKPEEIAEAVNFLLSDGASGITGIDLPVDTGWLAGISWLAFDGIPESR